MSLLQDIFKGTLGPYKPKVTLTIVGVSPTKKYRVDGEDREMRSAVGTDGEHYARLNMYDKGKFTRLEVGNVLSLLNIITKKEDGRMVVVATKNSKVFIGQVAEVTDNQKAEASKILNPPPAATVPIAQAITSPVKTKISIEGKIVQEAQPQTVSVKGEDVQIKTIMVSDRSAKVKVTLWREAANAEVRPGDYISITDAVTNTWKNETSLSTTSVSTIQKCEAPIEDKMSSVVGTSAEGEMVDLLLSDDEIISVDRSMLIEALALHGLSTSIEDMAKEGPVSISFSTQESVINSIKIN